VGKLFILAFSRVDHRSGKLPAGILILPTIAVIARDRRHRRDLVIPMTALTGDDGGSGDATFREPVSE
jgi:hypothetical protein